MFMSVIPKYIEIRNADGKPVAYLSPQADGIKEVYIDNELNGNCQLVFDMPLTSEKWQYISDQYELVVNGKHFILLRPEAQRITRDGQKVWDNIIAQEKWIELDKDYVSITNDPTGHPLDPLAVNTAPWGTVIIVSGGTPAGGYPAGSAGSAMTYLLAGSGWTLLTCDVTGTFDLETEKISILANIKKVQELWGGLLVWDSENKTVSLRSESTWQNYTGFQIRYAKNLKGITRTTNRDLVTRLYPFGKEDLNIAAVNGGVIYVDNFTYTNKVYKGQWVNQDIVDQTELKTKAIVELAKLCKPRYSYKITMLDLSVKPQWAHETFALGDMADVIDLDIGANDRLRIVRHKYNVFQKWKCEVDVGEPLEKLSSRIADTSAVTEKVLANTGTSNLFKGIINTKATEINGASGDYSLVDGVSTWWGSVNGVRNGKLTRITPNGLIVSEDGGQTWKTAVDGSGVYGDVIVAGSSISAPVIDGGSINIGSGKFTVNSAGDFISANGDITGKFKVKASDGTLLADIDKNASGGLLYLYDANGYVNAKLGVEVGQSPATNRGGTFILYDDMPTGLTDVSDILKYQRCEAGIQSSGSDNYSYGTYSLRHGYRVLGDASQSKSAITVQINAGLGAKGYGHINLWDRNDTTNEANSKVLISAGHPDYGYYGGFINLNDNSGQTRLNLGVNSLDSGQIILYKSGSTSIQLQDDLVYFQNAKVGIGKNNPSYALDIVGSIALTENIGCSGFINCNSGYRTNGNTGVSGTFKSGDSTQKTITVTNGIITGIN